MYAQEIKIKERHKVKKSETLFGIAKNYGITIEELSEVNPEMKMPGYSLKKGDYINIPYPNDNKIVNNTTEQKQPTAQQLPISRPIKVGVMLPLHDINGDGKRMIEYYRGLLLSCDRLKKDNISIDINAWNVPIDADIRTTLLENEASKCDIIFGPLYTSMVKPLADFCQKNDIMMVIPFSISGNDVAVNSHIFQVYQAQEDLNKITTQQFIGQFKDYHPIIVDAGDVTSDKGQFTKELRQRLESVGLSYSITHLKASDADFMKCFSKNGRNIVIINTGKSPELNT
ncbi:MAG: LysM domain-containing protein, partial [Prevotella sp.]|nr:LysM domain-containing protein [Prevotella sp.]